MDGPNFFEGAVGPTTGNTTAALRQAGGCTDTDNNASDFSLGAPNPRNTASPLALLGSTRPALAQPIPAPSSPGTPSLLTVVVTPGANPPSTGLAVTGDLSPIGGSASQAFYDDGTHGDVTTGDDTFSFQATVSRSTTAGAKTLPASITDAEARSGAASIALTVRPPLRGHPRHPGRRPHLAVRGRWRCPRTASSPPSGQTASTCRTRPPTGTRTTRPPRPSSCSPPRLRS